jgi:hypothetical protein
MESYAADSIICFISNFSTLKQEKKHRFAATAAHNKLTDRPVTKRTNLTMAQH